jgi:hypothetical protein
MNTPEVMTPKSPRWDEFCDALDKALGLLDCGGDGTQLDRKTGKVIPLNPDWPTHALTKRVLKLMGHVDVEASIDFYKQHGGYCDCEVMLNVVMNEAAYDLAN